MKKQFLIIFLSLFITSCTDTNNIQSSPSAFIELGSPNSDHIWVYLCGLSQSIDSEKEGAHLQLNAIGTHLNIKFLAITPQNRCKDLQNKLCWPNKTKDEILQTYQKIKDAIGDKKIDGFIGFSNGGFFLNRLAQYVELKTPIISIGAAGPLEYAGKVNTIYLLIGKKDEWHYEHAKNFYAAAQNSNVKINLIEYEDGHVIPENILEKLLESLPQGDA